MRRLRAALLLSTALLAAACASTTVTESWSDPAFQGMRFNKVLVVFQHKDPGLRRTAEDEMSLQIPNATPSYRILADDEVRDMERAKQKVRAEGYDAAVVMRVVGVERETTFVPTAPMGGPGFWGHWGWGWGMAYDPGYLRTDRIVTVGTNIYAVSGDKLVWSSRSESFNPTSLRETVREVVKVTAKGAGDALRKPA